MALYFHHLPSMLALLFLLGVQATFFGPVKYGILPQHLKETEIVGGNALVETGTFVAILLGTMLGGILMGRSELGLDLELTTRLCSNRPLRAGVMERDRHDAQLQTAQGAFQHGIVARTQAVPTSGVGLIRLVP
ncbi:MAG: hypothetical protein OEW21_04195 [Betaproteobacteria bacterium]|nr:hypothetical protein [Betaproteobacteria bacterium]